MTPMRRSVTILICLLTALAGAWLLVRGPAQAAGTAAAPVDTTVPLVEQDSYAQTVITPTDPAAANFGSAVVAQDNLMAVGAFYTEIGSLTAGKVFLFRPDAQSPTGWTEFKALQAGTPQNQARYGESLALQGDTLIVGAPWDPRNGGLIQGAVSVYERDQGGPDNWGFVAGLADEVDENGRWFGKSLAIDGDLVAVGVVGADDVTGTLDETGKVFLYSRAAGWTRIKEFTDPDGQERDWFGAAVALQGDTLVIGASAADADPTNGDSGVVFVYERDQGGAGQWGQVARLTADTPSDGANFGFTLALEGNTLAVGAFNERRETSQPSVGQAGAVFLFERNEGGPNSWGQVAALRPDDPPPLEMFGRSLALDGDDLWVGAPNSSRGGDNSQGALFRFGRNEGGANAWGKMDLLFGNETTRYSEFGSAVATAAGQILVGADGAGGVNSNTGAVYALTALEDLNMSTYPVMLPLAAHDWAPPVGTLDDGGTVEESSGAIVGAVPGTLDAPAALTIVVSTIPLPALPGGFLPRGDTYRISASRQIIAPAEQPFLAGLPVPAGTDVSKLGVALHNPDGLVSEYDEPPGYTRSWSTTPGSYDPATNLFVFTMRAMLQEGVSAVLYEHPDNVPLPAPVIAAGRTAQAVEYNVTCAPAAVHNSVCNQIGYDLVSGLLEDAHDDFVNTHGFQKPALVHAVGAFVGPDKNPVLIETDYRAVIASAPCINSAGTDIAGEYHWVSHNLLICPVDTDNTDTIKNIVRHELFHAIQASYTNMADDFLNTKLQPLTHWTIEGTASAAEKSGFIMARQTNLTLRMATEPLTSTVSTIEYDAQDFWVFTGLRGPQSNHYIEYLQDTFEKGATPEHVDQSMDLGKAYWEWAKNQVIEHYELMLGAFDRGECELDLGAVGLSNIKVLRYPDTFFTEGELPPLTSAVIEIRSSIARATMPVSAGASGEPSKFKYKVYEAEGTPGCKDDVQDGGRILEDIPAGGSRFVLVSNLSLDQNIEYGVEVD